LFREKLISILNLTTSENDNEALLAIRTANKLIQKNGVSWELLLDEEGPRTAPRQQSNSYYRNQNVEPEPTVEGLISYIKGNAWTGFDSTFVDSIAKNYETFGKISYRQMQGLKNVYERIREHNGGKK
jgi:hypothetical protein